LLAAGIASTRTGVIEQSEENVTRKHWFGWAVVAVFAALFAVIFWPKSERTRQKREPARAAVAEEQPVSNDSEGASSSPPEVEPVVARALPEASSATVPASAPPTEADDTVPGHTDVQKAQLARLPVIYAIRGDYPNDQARFEAMRDALQKSGASTEAWTGSARSIFERWGSALDGIQRTVDSGSLRCYVAGCEMRVTFPDRATFEQGSAKFRGIADQTPMGRVQTPGVSLPDGQVRVSWILLRPDTAPPDAE
jgi:hypothetical protein